MFRNVHNPSGSSPQASNPAARRRAVFITLVLALVIGGAGQPAPAQAAPAGATPLKFSMRAVKEREGLVCRGELVHIGVNVDRDAEIVDDELQDLGAQVTGVEVKGLVQNADIGELSPNNNTTIWAGAMSPGAADFIFTARKIGSTLISFRGLVVTPGWFGTNWGGGSQAVSAFVHVEVVPCKFKVTTIGQWSVPGPANINVSAISDDAEVKAQDGGSNTGGEGVSLVANLGRRPALQGPLTGSTTVNWVLTTDQVEDCIAQSVTASSQLDWTGQTDESGQLSLDGTYQSAAMSLPTYCVGSDGGIASGSTPIQLALDELQVSSPSSGGVSSQSQVLHGPEDTPGSVTVIVVPDEDETAALTPNDQAALSPWVFLASVGLAITPALTRRKPMKHLSSKRWMVVLLIFIFLLVLSACGAGADGPPADSQVTDGAPADSQESEEVIVEADVVFGPGAFIFPDTTAGLADLSSYKAILTLSFNGSRDGQDEQWSRTYVMLSKNEPTARYLTIQASGDLPDLDPVFLAEADGAAYEHRGESACNATVIDPENSQIDRLAPAALLTGVIGAEEAGSETVNDVAAAHYTFDERAFGQLGLAESTGEMWVASEGGYIVKYLVITEGDAAYFGEGIEGMLTWDYALTDINVPAGIELPADCPAGMVDAPLLPDASNVLNMPSVLAYNTSSSPADAAAFYQEKIPALGWELQGEPTLTDTTAILKFTGGGQTMTVVSFAGDGGTKVHILLSRSSGQAVTVDPPAVTATGETPLLPDAFNVVQTADLLTYVTSATIEEAAAFYKERLPGLGWELLAETSLGPTTSLVFTKGDQSMSVLISTGAGATTITIAIG